MALMGLLLIAMSCGNDDEPVDSAKPVITIQSPAAGDIVVGSITIKASAEDLSLKKMEVYVDNSQIHEATNSSVEIAWDSKTVSDGQHTLKVVATDANANRSEATVQVTVKNILFAITVPDDYVAAGINEWLFFSDDAGLVLDAKPVIDNTTLTFFAPNNYKTGQSFAMHVFRAEGGVRMQYTFLTMPQVQPGSYTLRLEPEAPNALKKIGEHTLFINSIPADSPTRTFWAGGVGVQGWATRLYPDKSAVSITANLVKNDTEVFYHIEDTKNSSFVPLYKMVSNARAGETTAVSVGELGTMSPRIMPLGQTYTTAAAQVLARQVKGDQDHEIRLSQSGTLSNVSELKTYVPEISFAEYRTQIVCVSDKTTRGFTQVGALPEAFKTVDATVEKIEFHDRALTVSTRGSYDELFVSSSASTDYLFTWTVYLPESSTNTLTLPVIPAAILSAFPKLATAPDLSFNYYGVMQDNSGDTFQQIIANEWFETSAPSKEPGEYMYTIFDYRSSTNGRLGAPVKDLDIKLDIDAGNFEPNSKHGVLHAENP